MFTYSLALFYISTKATISIEKRLVITHFCIESAYENGDIASILFIRSESNLADALTKNRKHQHYSIRYNPEKVISQKRNGLTESRPLDLLTKTNVGVLGYSRRVEYSTQ